MTEPQIYFFDMDHTLQNNDSDVSWKEFLVKMGVAPADAMQRADFFYDAFLKGTLDPDEFVKFQLQEFVGRTQPEMEALAERHFLEFSKPKIYAEARRLVNDLKATGKPRVLLTATNRIIATPFMRELGLDDIIATELVMNDGRYTGAFAGEYCAEEGKVTHATAYCRARGLSLDQAAYYGDSMADRFILAASGFPTAVNPAPKLREIAEAKGWPILDFKKS